MRSPLHLVTSSLPETEDNLRRAETAGWMVDLLERVIEMARSCDDDMTASLCCDAQMRAMEMQRTGKPHE